MEDKNSQPMREKYWKELSIEEKIERTREQEKRTQMRLDDLYNLVQRVVVEFEKHEHHDEKILLPIPITSFGYSGEMIGAETTLKRMRTGKSENPDEVYF